MSSDADLDTLVSAASREALERLVRAAAASGAISIDAIQKAVSGQFQGKPRVLGVIPARFGSTRFPGKPLAVLGGKPMIWHTYTNASKSKNLDFCVVATDDQRIYDTVKGFGGEVFMTDPKWENASTRYQAGAPVLYKAAKPNIAKTDGVVACLIGRCAGTERCLEVLRKLQADGKEFDIVVNIQGDEPFIEEEHIDKVVEVVANSDAVMGTLARPAKGEDDVKGLANVKTVLDVNGYALYFSRAMIPHNKKGAFQPTTHYWRKLGIYSYRADFLPKFIDMPVSLLQRAEDLEQNKVIEAGYKIKVGIVADAHHGVDTPEQLVDLNRIWEEEAAQRAAAGKA